MDEDREYATGRSLHDLHARTSSFQPNYHNTPGIWKTLSEKKA